MTGEAEAKAEQAAAELLAELGGPREAKRIYACAERGQEKKEEIDTRMNGGPMNSSWSVVVHLNCIPCSGGSKLGGIDLSGWTLAKPPETLCLMASTGFDIDVQDIPRGVQRLVGLALQPFVL